MLELQEADAQHDGRTVYTAVFPCPLLEGQHHQQHALDQCQQNQGLLGFSEGEDQCIEAAEKETEVSEQVKKT